VGFPKGSEVPARFGGAIGVADSAGGDDGMGDLCVGGSLPPALFRGRHVRQEIELALAVDQDRDQRLAVLFLLLNTVGKVVRHARETLLRCTMQIARALAGPPRTRFSLKRPALAGV
jgi:hypothetical protein